MLNVPDVGEEIDTVAALLEAFHDAPRSLIERKVILDKLKIKKMMKLVTVTNNNVEEEGFLSEQNSVNIRDRKEELFNDLIGISHFQNFPKSRHFLPDSFRRYNGGKEGELWR